MKMPAQDRLGKPGVGAIGLLLFCLSYYVVSIAPARDELARLQGEQARLTVERATTGPGPAAATAAKPASHPLPSFSTANDALKNLNAIAERHGVTVDRATYQLSDNNGLRRLRITLPLKGNYPSLRAWLNEVLEQPTTLTLDELTLQRRAASEALIEADAQLSYYFAPAP